MRNLAYRITLTCINIFFPPLAVMMLCGASMDCLLNCCFFVLAVIPSHIHGFWISCTYFHRRSKVRKGRYPGGRKSMLFSTYVTNGGASDKEVERLYLLETGPERLKGRRRRNGRSGSRSGEVAERGRREARRPASKSGRVIEPSQPLSPMAEHVARDGYGPVKLT